jgi:hypothetical protein
MIPPPAIRPADIPQALHDAGRTLARGCENAPDLAFGLVARVLREVAEHPNPKRAALVVVELMAVERSIFIAEHEVEEERKAQREQRRKAQKGFQSGGMPKPSGRSANAC